MIPKPGKNLSEVESYRPISLLPIMAELFEKWILKHLKPIAEEKHLVPTHQFGFRKNRSTIDQVHRITDIIEKTLENNGVCSTTFLDIAQAFDRVWHRGPLYKLRFSSSRSFLSTTEILFNQSTFLLKHEDSYSELKLIKAGISQGNVLGPDLYLLYNNDVPTTPNSTMATFANDTAVMAIGETIESSTRKLQSAVNNVALWAKASVSHETAVSSLEKMFSNKY
jgi:hypothetical protein